MEEKNGLPFISGVQSCTGKSYMTIFFAFFCHICRTTVCWDLEICYHGNVTQRFLLSIERQVLDRIKDEISLFFFYSSYLFIYLFEGRNFGRTIITLALTLLWMKKRKRKVMTVRICSTKKRKMTKKTFSMYGVTSHIPSTLAAVMQSLYIV